MAHVVLLVDDEPNVLAGLRRALRNESYEIVTAQSGAEALTILKSTPVDVVVSDQQMPGMSGTQLLKKVRESFPDTVRFILTGKATLDVAIEAINDGAISRFFTKPCNGVDLAVTIRQALQHKELMSRAWQLLSRLRQREALLDQLETKFPGITSVETDARGTIVLEESPPADYDNFIEELHKALGA